MSRNHWSFGRRVGSWAVVATCCSLSTVAGHADDPAPADAPPAAETAAAGPAGTPAGEGAPTMARNADEADPEAWRTRHPVGFESWRPIKQKEWEQRLVNSLANLRLRLPESKWAPDDVRLVEENLERAIRTGVAPDVALTFAQRCIQWGHPAGDCSRILLALIGAVRSDGKCCNLQDLLEETFSTIYRGDDLVNALANEIRKRRRFEEGMIPQEERRRLERQAAEEATRLENLKRAVEARGKTAEQKEEDKKRH